MSAAIAITRRDLTAGELRAGAARSREAQASRRMLAIALVLAGGAAAIALIRLTAADVPAADLSVGEIVDRAAARLREFGLLP